MNSSKQGSMAQDPDGVCGQHSTESNETGQDNESLLLGRTVFSCNEKERKRERGEKINKNYQLNR